MKRIRIIPLICITVLCMAILGGCGEKSETVSMYDLRTAMEDAADGLPEMMSADSSSDSAQDLFGYISELEYSKVDAFFVSYAKEGTADEIAVIAVKNAADVKDAEDSLRQHVQDRANVFSQYAPDQVKRVENAQVFTSGNYAVLIICDDPVPVKAAFEQFIDK